MSFSATQIQFLQRLVSEKPASRKAGEVARYFCEHYSLGTQLGRSIEYRDSHHRAAESLLRAHDLPVHGLSPESSRADVAAFGGLSEKTFSAAPHTRSVAVKFVGTCTLEGRPVSTPPGTYMVVTPEVAGRIACERLMLVENLESFRRLEDYAWLDYQARSVMVVFRGDRLLAIGDAVDVIRSRPEPVWAFVDFDPAGLVIANSLPAERLERVLVPSMQWLQQAADTTRGRQLFADQADQYTQTLENCSNGDIRSLWAAMREWKSAVTQERMTRA